MLTCAREQGQGSSAFYFLILSPTGSGQGEGLVDDLLITPLLNKQGGSRLRGQLGPHPRPFSQWGKGEELRSEPGARFRAIKHAREPGYPVAIAPGPDLSCISRGIRFLVPARARMLASAHSVSENGAPDATSSGLRRGRD